MLCHLIKTWDIITFQVMNTKVTYVQLLYNGKILLQAFINGS